MKGLPFISPTTRSEEKRGNGADESIPQINYYATSTCNCTQLLRTLSSQRVNLKRVHTVLRRHSETLNDSRCNSSSTESLCHHRPRPNPSRRRYALSPVGRNSTPTAAISPGEEKTRLLIRDLLIRELVVSPRRRHVNTNLLTSLLLFPFEIYL
ncbi:hypothetical protein AVEN_56629-1 [Araneus ventricosus]|uniref:Uncharacterized protein n=1 Tax=Araneus ventricosus TaxID=182803 RepID=A0A4Y2F330_ARAVE|nr:hypothetical protein AVEN_56629-1 [Araneus ventricosus]